MLSSKECAAGGGADGGSGVVAGEAHAIASELVEMGRFDLFLPVAADFAVAEIISEDEDDVRPLRGKS